MKKRLAGLSEFLNINTLLRVNRKPLDEHSLNGYLVGLSERLLLLHLVDGSTLTLNGYVAVRLSDVQKISPDDHFSVRALPLLNRVPVPPPAPLNLDDMGAFLASVQRSYPLVSLELEKKEPGHIFIGRIVKQTARHLTLHKINSEGYWYEEERFALSAVTQAAAGDGYATALAALVAHEDGPTISV